MKKTLIFLLMVGLCLPVMAADTDPVKEGGMMFPDGRIMQPSDFKAEEAPMPEKVIAQPEEEVSAPAVAPKDENAEVKQEATLKEEKVEPQKFDKKAKRAHTPRRRNRKKPTKRPENKPTEQPNGDKVPPELTEASESAAADKPVPSEK